MVLSTSTSSMHSSWIHLQHSSHSRPVSISYHTYQNKHSKGLCGLFHCFFLNSLSSFRLSFSAATFCFWFSFFFKSCKHSLLVRTRAFPVLGVLGVLVNGGMLSKSENGERLVGGLELDFWGVFERVKDPESVLEVDGQDIEGELESHRQGTTCRVATGVDGASMSLTLSRTISGWLTFNQASYLESNRS